ncbi:MAG: hypothetical protein AAFR46_14315 [Pseudomonadota bacterium]
MALMKSVEDAWRVGVPCVVDPRPVVRSPLDDMRDATMPFGRTGDEPLGLTNDGKTMVYATSAVEILRDPRGTAR